VRLGFPPSPTSFHRFLLTGLAIAAGSRSLLAPRGTTHLVVLVQKVAWRVYSRAAGAQTDDPLITSAREGDQNKVLRLLDQGAKLDTSDTCGNTTLHIACKYGHASLVKLLLDRGADAHARNMDGETPLHLAAQMGDFETATMLVEKGADVKAVSDFGDTPLHFASEMRNWEMAQIVGGLRAGSPYEWKKDNLKVAELLIARGADINAQNCLGRTPLHRTTPLNNLPVAKLLVDHGARLDLKNNEGQTPLAAAKRNRARAIVEFLKSLEKK